MKSGRFYVYAVELDKPHLRRPSVYVGSSALPPEERLRHHKRGGPSTSRHVRRDGVRLLPEAYWRLNAQPLRSRDEARQAEQELRRRFEARGWRVFGACRRHGTECLI